ncbi:MAG: hypothetical protein AMXMBFR13_00060 [Phycisphaerae bacterium]
MFFSSWLTQSIHGRRKLAIAGLLSWIFCAGCGQADVAANNQYSRDRLDAMQTARITVDGQTFEVWLATNRQQREKGLMEVTEEQLAPVSNSVYRGMLFVFPDEQDLAFWMLNTITPLDIAYINGAGRIVRTYTMAPLETRLYHSVEPARFALEVRAGLFEQLGIAAGDQVDIDSSLADSAQ